MKHEYEIETGMEMPLPRERGLVYPFMDMKVGDSFAVPLNETVRAARLCTAAAYFANRNGVKFTTRIDRAKGVRRCWRIE